MHFLSNLTAKLMSDEWRHFALKTGVCTTLAGVCGYGGTFFFTSFNPRIGASYFAVVALVGQIAYEILEQLKSPVEDSPWLKRMVTAVQFLQIPLCFYLLHGTSSHLSAAVKLEIICATAYFTAIPIFFHLAVKAWNDPTASNIAKAVGVMLPLANGLGNYAKNFK